MTPSKEIPYRFLIKPIYDNEVRSLVSQLSADNLIVADEKYSMLERVERIDTLYSKCGVFYSHFFSNLEQFPFFYVLNGNTEYINLVFARQSNINFFEDDYFYYKVAGKSFDKKRTTGGDLIFSYPSWQRGGEENMTSSLDADYLYKHLDVAYAGLVYDYKKIDLSDFQTVGISFSKTFAIPYNRLSVLYSKVKIPHLELLKRVGYVNLSAIEIVNHLMGHLSTNFWIEKYWDKYIQVCHQRSLRASNCLLFAHDGNGQRISTAEYLRG